MTIPTMETTITALLASGKGILAADESLPTIGERFAALDIPSIAESHRDYRELLFTTPGLSEAISGVILFDETMWQETSAGVAMPEILTKAGIIPGVKVDKGTIALPDFDREKLTQGLDGLRERLIEYRERGARFTKWRAVMAIDEHLPTRTCIEANARALALFAALSQEAGLAPIVEPEVLMNGHHTIARCEEVTTVTLKSIFDALFEHRVVLEQMLLKTGMVLSGEECPEQAGVAAVVEATRRCLRRAVPAAVPGIVFLSGGQSDEAATERLNAICRGGDVPWKLSFSFGRALQSAAIKIWKGSPENAIAAQEALRHRAHCNSAAVEGRYAAEMENNGSR
jgi:fructose-bisphosphate aldolase, class I